MGGGDLVAHQRQQRRDDERRAEALLAAHPTGDEVDRRLSPTRALHDQYTALVTDERFNGFELAGTKGGVVSAGQIVEDANGVITQGHVDTVSWNCEVVQRSEISPGVASSRQEERREVGAFTSIRATMWW